MGSLITAYKSEELPRNYFRMQVGVLRIFGIELVEEETLLYRIYSKLALFVIVYSFTCTELFEFFCQWGNVERMVQVMSYLITHLLGLIKVTMLYVNRNKMKKILRQFHEAPLSPNMERDWNEEKRLIRDVIRVTDVQSLLLSTSVAIVLGTGILDTVIVRLFKEKDEWKYAFTPISVIGTTNSPEFEIACLYQIFCMMTCACVIVSIDLLLATILAHLSVQLKVLQNAFRNIRQRARAVAANHEDEEHHMKTILGQYINQHQMIFDLSGEMEALCNKMFLMIMVASVGLLCFILFTQSTLRIGSILFVEYITYYWVVLCEIGWICYWGSEVTLQSLGVAGAVAEVDWPGAPISFSKALVVIMARSQMTLQLTAGKFVPLSLTTLLGIVKGSFSYYMVLRRSQED